MEEKQLEDFLPDKKSSYIKKFNNSNISTKITKKQFAQWGVKYHDLKFGKPYYDLFIDDKNMNTKNWK